MSEWISIGPLELIPRLGSRTVTTRNGNVAIFRTSDDQLFALRDHCPHKGGPLSQGIIFGHRVACPLHNWSIDLESGEAAAPDKGCARRHKVKVENGVVMVSA
jgi:nitrite reductase (NADH) small subunit